MELFPLNVEDLIHARSVESIRIEYKTSFNDVTKNSIIATISAFANDFQNLNGGFLIIGINSQDGEPELPPVGLELNALEKIQQKIRVACKHIDPEYQPLIIPISFQEKNILIIWAPAGDNRPYKSFVIKNNDKKCFHVRQGAETVQAKGEIERQLIELTARIPFDDRRNLSANILDISPILVKRFLKEINSELLNLQPLPNDLDLYKSIRICNDYQGVQIPRNIGLLFFNEKPDKFFTGCLFEVVHFADDAGGNLIEEKKFIGPLDNQINSVVEYLDNLTNVQIRKLPGKTQVERTIAFPYEALEEAIANAAYHRSYDNVNEPNKVYLYPDRMEIISYPGPVSGITLEHLKGSSPIPPIPSRNRRIGELLKELRLAEMRGTGIPKIRRVMQQNGSSDPIIDFDSERTFFRVILPAHPRYLILHALRESIYQWSIGERKTAIERLLKIFKQQNNSGAVAAQLIYFLYEYGDTNTADKIFYMYHDTLIKTDLEQPYLRYFKILFNIDASKARKIIDLLPETEYMNSPYEIAVAYKRLNIFDKSHTIFSKIFGMFENDAHYLQNFAEVKMAIAQSIYKKRNPNWQTIRRLLKEAIELLHRSIPLQENSSDRAWCYFDLARALKRLKYTPSQIHDAYKNAIENDPNEKIFSESYKRWEKFNPK